MMHGRREQWRGGIVMSCLGFLLGMMTTQQAGLVYGEEPKLPGWSWFAFYQPGRQFKRDPSMGAGDIFSTPRGLWFEIYSKDGWVGTPRKMLRPQVESRYVGCKQNELLAAAPNSARAAVYRLARLEHAPDDATSCEFEIVKPEDLPELYRPDPLSLLLPWQGGDAHLQMLWDEIKLVEPLVPDGKMPEQVLIDISRGTKSVGVVRVPKLKAPTQGRRWIKIGDRLVIDRGVLHVVRFAIPDPERKIVGWVEFRWSPHEPSDIEAPPSSTPAKPAVPATSKP